ncbi:MAG: hypothetical protein ACLQUY_24110 [Ktedonobacterales bacterium]
MTWGDHTLYLHRKGKHALIPCDETRFHRADDLDVDVSFESRDQRGLYTRLRVVEPFFWFTAERSTPPHA